MGNKFVAQIQLGQRTCRPSRAKKGLKDWAIDKLSEQVMQMWGCQIKEDIFNRAVFSPFWMGDRLGVKTSALFAKFVLKTALRTLL
jgi:hypothetical protein